MRHILSQVFCLVNNVSILEMSAFYSEMQEKFNQWNEYDLEVAGRIAKLFEDTIVHHDDGVFDNSGSKTQELLQLSK